MNALASSTTPTNTPRPDARIALLTQLSTGPSRANASDLI